MVESMDIVMAGHWVVKLAVSTVVWRVVELVDSMAEELAG
jgi:hypothetical protein